MPLPADLFVILTLKSTVNLRLQHAALVDLLRQAYSAEKAASFAYQGHVASLSSPKEKADIKQVEMDEWEHRREVLKIMNEYGIPISRKYELKYYVIGKIIAASCFIIGRFMPIYFAGRLESGNVCEYFRMKQYFNSLGITKHDRLLYEMGMKEKEHEIYFLQMVQNDPLLPRFEKWFAWGAGSSYNNIDLDKKYPVEESDHYCPKK